MGVVADGNRGADRGRLSAVEPVILYQRRRFRGGEGAPGTPRYELGIQQKQDALHRLVDIWATGEAGASLGFQAARLFDAAGAYRTLRKALTLDSPAFGEYRARCSRQVVGHV